MIPKECWEVTQSLGTNGLSIVIFDKFSIKIFSYDLKDQLSLSQHYALGTNEYMLDAIPLHLQLCNINLDKKFKKQKLIFNESVPFLPYFCETLKRFNLKVPDNLNNLK